jgi:uncharacterized protein YqgC (DUF456 family)
MDVLLWAVAVALIALGVAGVVVPALPGIALVYGGIVLGAWIGNFEKIGSGTLIALGVLAGLGFVIDYAATTLAAQKAGASRLGLIGAAVGTVVGIFMGLIGLFFMPLLGAAIGEFIARRDALRAGRIGVATWIGLLAGIVAKLAICFAMIGVFVLKLIL